MIGLRTQEPQKVINSHKLILNEAKKLNKIFFEESGDGNELITEDLWLENVWGWLIPKEKAQQFNELYVKFDESLLDDNSEWWKYYLCAEWEKTKDGYKISFIDYPNYFE